MELRVPASGRLEWLVQPGAAVRDGAVLARLVVEDHCAIVPILAPGTGVVTWLRPAALPRVAARAVVGLLDATPQELAISPASEPEKASPSSRESPEWC